MHHHNPEAAQPARHHHNHGSHGGHQHHQGCAHHRQMDISPQQFFEKIEQLKANGEYELYWMEIIKGTFWQKKMEVLGCAFLGSLNCQVLTSIFGMFHMMLNFEWLPNRVRPFISGIFVPLIILTLLNSNVLGIELTLSPNSIVLLLPLFLFTLTALRGTGNIANEQNRRKAIKAFQLRPYLQNGPLKCNQCKIPKVFRAMHCPVCKICNPKFTRHSLVFGTCIGAANQLLALLFFFSVFLFGFYSVYMFWFTNTYGLITKIMIYSINIYAGWNGLLEFLTLSILNLYYGITQFEAQSWIMLQYMMKFPERKFFNNIGQGFLHNFKESCYALFGLSGFESEEFNDNKDLDEHPLKQQINQEDELGFPELLANKKYTVNWAKAFFYLIPQIPNHPFRDDIMKIMKVDEPKMIQNFTLMKKFKAEIAAQFPDMNQFQIQQRAMMKMHEHMAKHGPPAHMQMKVPPQQQKVIQLQMIGHLKQQFTNDKQMFSSFESLETKLKNGSVTPEEASLSLRELQQKILQIKMNQVLKQQESMKTSKSKSSSEIKEDDKIEPRDITKLNEKLQSQVKTGPSNTNLETRNIPKISPQPNSMQINHQANPMQMMMPSPEQQKAMMIMSFGNIKAQFYSHKQIIEQVERLESGLKNDSLSLDEARMSMMKLQPQLMQIKMNQMGKHSGDKDLSSHPMMPPPQQQKAMMIMSFGNIKAQFSSHKQIIEQVERLEFGLKDDSLSLEEAKMSMMKLQPQLMQIKMNQTTTQNETKQEPSPMMPSAEQQKSMLLIGIQNMRQKYPEDEYISKNLEQLKKSLTEEGMEMHEARIKMSQIQNHLMKKVIEQTKRESEQNSSNEELQPDKLTD